MSRQVSALLVFFALWVRPCLAGGVLSIRLIEASNQEREGSGQVEDVADVLRRSFVYKNYSLLASASMPLPAVGASRTLGAYTVTCSGPQSDLTIVVRRGRQQVLRTAVNLQNRTPLILGGFPSGSGALVLVFVAR